MWPDYIDVAVLRSKPFDLSTASQAIRYMKTRCTASTIPYPTSCGDYDSTSIRVRLNHWIRMTYVTTVSGSRP